MIPGNSYNFIWAIGGKKMIYSSPEPILITVPANNMIDTMKGDFVTFKGASHMTASVFLASAAMVSMTLY